jgi:hypothetical protein
MEENCIGSQIPQRTVALEKKKKNAIQDRNIKGCKIVEFTKSSFIVNKNETNPSVDKSGTKHENKF